MTCLWERRAAPSGGPAGRRAAPEKSIYGRPGWFGKWQGGGRCARNIGNFSSTKMLGQLEALCLVIRTDAAAIESIGPRQHAFIDQAAHDLALLDDEWHLMGTHLQHRAGTVPACARVTEAWIEEASIVDAKFAHQRIKRNHFGCIIGRHLDSFLRGQDVEFAGIENQAAVVPCPDWLPEFRDVVAGTAIHVDDASVTLGAVTDEFVGTEADEIDSDRNAIEKVGSLIVDEALPPVHRRQRLVRQNCLSPAKPELRQARPFAHQHREGTWADLGVKRTVVAGIDAVESPGLICNHPGEDVEPAGRTFWIGCSRDVRRQG